MLTITGQKILILKKFPRFLREGNNYALAFGTQWKKWKKTQLDSYTKTRLSQIRLYRCMGKALLFKLRKMKAPSILEAGCGAGRFTEVLLQIKNAYLTSIDLSAPVEVNAENFPITKKHRIIQTDLTKAPFNNNSFDVVICLGVLQHTPDPENSISELFRLVKPGGSLVIDHYPLNISYYTKLTPFIIRPFIKRLSKYQRFKICKILVDVFFPLHKTVRHYRILQNILSRISPILTYFHALPELNDKQQYEWSLLDTHDSLTDWYKHHRTVKQIYSYLKKIGAHNIHVWIGGNGIEARCIKPKSFE